MLVVSFLAQSLPLSFQGPSLSLVALVVHWPDVVFLLFSYAFVALVLAVALLKVVVFVAFVAAVAPVVVVPVPVHIPVKLLLVLKTLLELLFPRRHLSCLWIAERDLRA